jgi:tetratricopeptide (TPR) repeat protein
MYTPFQRLLAGFLLFSFLLQSCSPNLGYTPPEQEVAKISSELLDNRDESLSLPIDPSARTTLSIASSLPNPTHTLLSQAGDKVTFYQVKNDWRAIVKEEIGSLYREKELQVYCAPEMQVEQLSKADKTQVPYLLHIIKQGKKEAVYIGSQGLRGGNIRSIGKSSHRLLTKFVPQLSASGNAKYCRSTFATEKFYSNTNINYSLQQRIPSSWSPLGALLLSTISFLAYHEPVQAATQDDFSYKGYGPDLLDKLIKNDPTLKSIDLRKEELTQKKLNDLLLSIKHNIVLGYIAWGDVPIGSENTKEKINEKLLENIFNYSYHPSHYNHGCFARDVYKLPNQGDSLSLNGDVWIVEKTSNQVPHEHSYGERNTNFYSALYVNKKKHQCVIAFKGTDSMSDWGENYFGILNNYITPYQKLTFSATKEAIEYARVNDYHLSITGHSLGGFLAELAVFYCLDTLNYPFVEGIVFDSPGSAKWIEQQETNQSNKPYNEHIKNFPLITYLVGPNGINTCNGHLGKIYTFQNDEKVDYLERQVTDALVIGRKISDGIKAHSLEAILSGFNETTGRPTKKYKRMQSWPDANTSLKETILRKTWYEKILARVMRWYGKSSIQYLTFLKEDKKNEFTNNYVAGYKESSLENHQDILYLKGSKGYNGVDDYLFEFAQKNIKINSMADAFARKVLLKLINSYTLERDQGANRPKVTLEDKQESVDDLRQKVRRIVEVFPTYLLEILDNTIATYTISNRLRSPIINPLIPRQEEQQKLEDCFKEAKICVIHGPGGTGKSTLAVAYAEKVKKDQGKIVWRLAADTKENLDQHLQELAKALYIDPETLTNRVQWKNQIYLALKNINQNILFIIDGISDAETVRLLEESLLVNANASDIPDNLKIIITTRNAGFFKDYSEQQLVNIKPFTNAQAKEYIKKSLKDREIIDQDIEDLIAEVTKIPKALSLATSYLNENFLTEIREYIDALKKAKKSKGNTSNSNKDIVPLVELGLNQLPPASQALMQYLVYLDADYIPLSLIKELEKDHADLQNKTKSLKALSLVEVITSNKKEKRGLRIHQDVQVACRDYFASEDNKVQGLTLLQNLINALLTKMPSTDSTPNEQWEDASTYAPHVASVILKLPKDHKKEEKEARLLDLLGYYNYQVQCEYQVAKNLFQEAYNIRKGLHGELDHASMATSMNNLGSVYKKIGSVYGNIDDINVGRNYIAEALKMRERLYKANPCPAEYLARVASLNNLGSACYKLNDVEKAVKYYEEAFTLAKEIFGEEYENSDQLEEIFANKPELRKDPKTLLYLDSMARSLDGIGNGYEKLPDLEKALCKKKEALSIREKYLYPDKIHRTIARSLHSVGDTYYQLYTMKKDRDYLSQAESYCKKSLKMLDDLYKKQNNPYVALTYSKLGDIYKDLSKKEEAKDSYREALKINEKLKNEEYIQLCKKKLQDLEESVV